MILNPVTVKRKQFSTLSRLKEKKDSLLNAKELFMITKEINTINGGLLAQILIAKDSSPKSGHLEIAVETVFSK